MQHNFGLMQLGNYKKVCVGVRKSVPVWVAGLRVYPAECPAPANYSCRTHLPRGTEAYTQSFSLDVH